MDSHCIFCYNDFQYDKDNYRDGFCSDVCVEKAEVAKKEAIQDKLKQIIPRKFWDLYYDGDIKIDNVFDKSLFITGKVGTGKTTLAASIVRRSIRRFVVIKWISFPKFIMTLQGMFKGDSNPFELAESVADTKDLLVIDDIGAEKMTEYVRQIAYFIINEREQNMKQTIITSNYNLDQIDQMIDSRVSSRIAGMCEVIKLTGKDRRVSK